MPSGTNTYFLSYKYTWWRKLIPYSLYKQAASKGKLSILNGTKLYAFSKRMRSVEVLRGSFLYVSHNPAPHH